MNKNRIIFLLFLGLLVIPRHNFAQENEESAAISLETYSDEFQEAFFDALKEKGIENYDKAIHLLLKCKQLDARNGVVDHELAKAYLADNQYLLAQEYSMEAIVSNPENFWYIDTLIDILEKQHKTFEGIKDRVPYTNEKLRENLAKVLYKRKAYTEALKILISIKSNPYTEELTSKIKDSIKERGQEPVVEAQRSLTTNRNNPMEEYTTKIMGQIANRQFTSLAKTALEASENYPSQPFFYYAHGWALNNTGKPKEAIEALQNAMDYLLDDDALADKIYKELASAYAALGQASKANMYLSKIKSRS